MNLWQGNVFTRVCASVHRGWVSVMKTHPDRDPPGQRPPWTETPQTETPPGQRPPQTKTLPGQRSPNTVTSAWYASYLNAFLLYRKLTDNKLKFATVFTINMNGPYLADHFFVLACRVEIDRLLTFDIVGSRSCINIPRGCEVRSLWEQFNR